jgi:hypothetical protein
MNRGIFSLLKVSVFLLAAGIAASFGASAQAQQPCSVEICKSAPGAGDQGFQIDFIDSGGTDTVELFDDSDCFTPQLNFNADVDIVEQPTPGWTLADVECQTSIGITITDIPGGVTALCTTEAEARASCTFLNLRGESSGIPPLSEWGMIAAAVGLVLIGAFYAMRRRKASA